MKSVASKPSGESRTFVVALWVLGVVAAVQFMGLVWKVLPRAVERPSGVSVLEEVYRPEWAAGTASTATQVSSGEANAHASSGTAGALVSAGETRASAAAAASGTPSPEEATRLQAAMARVAEAERASRVGDWEGVLAAIAEAEAVLGEEPRLMLQKAFALERLGREMDAAALLVRVLTRSDLDEKTRREALRLQDWVSQTIENMERAGLTPAPATQTQFLQDSGTEEAAAPMLEEIGLQPGATLGIVDVREIQSDEPGRKLRVAVKARPSVRVSAADMKVVVRFFEKDADGNIIPAKSEASSEWISPPIDWAEKEPEILEVRYIQTPKSKNTYYGYTVAIYYRDELQDTRANPVHLDDDYPSDLFLESNLPPPP